MNIRLLLVATLASASLLSACIVAPAGRPIYREPVMVAPPPPRVEYRTPPPAEGYIWISGFWNWEGGHHEWVPGRWEQSRQGHNWVPHTWVREGDQWRQQGGHWEERHQEERRDEHRHDHDHERDGR